MVTGYLEKIENLWKEEHNFEAIIAEECSSFSYRRGSDEFYIPIKVLTDDCSFKLCSLPGQCGTLVIYNSIITALPYIETIKKHAKILKYGCLMFSSTSELEVGDLFSTFQNPKTGSKIYQYKIEL